MEVVVLGSGTAVPHPQRSSPGFWLETDSGTLLLDFGPSVLHRLAQEGLDWAAIDAIWLSHFHLDHCGGLPAYLFATRHAPQTQNRQAGLKIYGGQGTRRLIDAFDKANNYKLFEQPFPFEIVEVEPLERFDVLPGIDAMAFKTPHTNESLAIRLELFGGGSLVYTSDTGFGKDLAIFAQRADLLIIESSFYKNKKTEIHLELAEAMYLIRKAKPKRAMLTHLYAEWDEVDLASEVAKFDVGCEVIEAVDGLRIELN